MSTLIPVLPAPSDLQSRTKVWWYAAEHAVPKSFGQYDADFVAIDDLHRFASLFECKGSMRTKTVVRSLADLHAHHLIFINAALDDTNKAVVSGLVMRGENLLFGPKAADEFTWELKPQANARGYLFEVAETPASLKRLMPSSLAAVQQKAALERIEAPVPIAPPGDEDKLDELPGVVAATQFLHSDRRGLDAEAVRKLFGLSRATLARITGIHQETIRKTPHSAALQGPLRRFERIARLLTFNPDKKNFLRWLNSPNTELDEKTPLELIKAKKAAIVETLVHDILTNRGR